jgi:TolB-like protein/Flp pilus assembly protein TadD/class 3 adenylate cyclase
MLAEPASELKFEIGHVLFIDIVGYSKLLINEQSEQIQKLKEIVRGTEQSRIAEAEGKLLRLPTGDGGALVFRTSPEAPVRCAIEISKELKRHPELRVRMGIHSGPVNEITDLNEQANIAGAGIDMAQRVMDCGDAGHILLSRHVAEDLEHYPRWRPHLHDLGECEVKHGVRVHAVNLYTEELGNPTVPEKFRRAKEKEPTAPATAVSDAKPARRRRALIAALVIATATAGFYIFSHRSSSTTPEKSIAVLPFDNLSEDKANAYFADGMQDEILARLSKIADLKVISRTSTQKYKSAPDNLREIAKQLGVANILEGSVQKTADQVRVNVQLINALSDAHLWADIYDRKLSDIFTVETEVATKIADTLQAKLSGSEHRAIAARPTENMEAHELYLRGRYFGGKRTTDNLERAINYYNQALAKDPKYAIAYAGIANCYVLLQEYSKLTAAEAFPKAQAAAARALAIDDNLGEAHAALALVMVDADFNFTGAKEEFERAIELNPNSSDAHYFFGISVLLPLGQFDQAIAEIKHAIALDPFSVIINANLGIAYIMARRYPEAIAQLRKTAELDPNSRQVHHRLGTALLLSGDVPGAIAEYEKGRESARKEGQGREYYADVFLAHLYGVSGNREKALKMSGEARQLEDRVGVWAYGYALIQIGLDNKEQAIDWLERSYQAKEQAWIKVDPMLDPLRNEPRFQALVQKVFSTQKSSTPSP